MLKSNHRQLAAAVVMVTTFGGLSASLAQPAGPPPAGPPPAGAPAGAPAPGGAPIGAMRAGPSGLTMDDVTIQWGPKSVARGAAQPPAHLDVGPGPGLTPGRPAASLDDNTSAKNGDTPQGVEALAVDIFSSKDFYKDRDLWTDQRYYRCASPAAFEAIHGALGPKQDGDDPPRTVSWGRCDRDTPREEIVSPYPFKTAQEQYETLLAEAKSRGGPTIHTAADLPNWNGVYASPGFQQSFSGYTWLNGSTMQVPTYLSLLTPEYQQRFVQQAYHYGATDAPQWPGSYCWPEGFIRQYSRAIDRWIMMVPEMVQVWSANSETLATHINIGSEFKMDGTVPYLSTDLRQWYGETVGFWDGDILISWTSNIQGWIAHGKFEFSNKLQTVEIYTPIVAKDTGKFMGLNHEVVLYDSDAFVEPLRFMENIEWARKLNGGTPFEWRECIQTLFPIEGHALPVSPGDTIEFTVPDMLNRPWAQIWDKYFEQNMDKPKGEDVLAGFE